MFGTLRCGDVEMWRCGDVEMWRCRNNILTSQHPEHTRILNIRCSRTFKVREHSVFVNIQGS